MSGSFLDEFALGFTISLVWLTIHLLSTYRRGNTPSRLIAISMIFSLVALYVTIPIPSEAVSSSLKSLIPALALIPFAVIPFLLRITVTLPKEFEIMTLGERD